MHKDSTQRSILLALSLVLTLVGAARAYAQSALDFSILSDANPTTTLSVTEGYKAAMSDGGWNNVSSDNSCKWSAPYQDNRFQQAVKTFGVATGYTYETYLVSPAINLTAVGGKTLSVDWSAASVKGDITLQMLVIDKNGTTLATLGSVTGVVGSKNTEWTNVSYAIPSSLSGTGFIAFASKSDDGKNNRASFNVRNIEIVDGQQPAAVSIDPSSLEFSETETGETSYEKTLNVSVSNFDGTPTAALTDGDTQDFTIVADGLSSAGGSILAYFTPKSAGEKTATLTVTAGDATATATLTGIATGQTIVDKPAVELLTDEFFYNFTDGKPTDWQTAGDVTQLEETYAFNSDTGYGVGLKTNSSVGYLRQTIDLTKEGKVVEAGDEIEGLIHYFTVSSERADGPFRLALRWLDSEGNELQSGERDLINNSSLYFGRRNAWGTLKFRTTCPTGAVKLEFGVEVAPNSNVRLDDFSAMRLDASGKTPLVAILPQYLTINGEEGVPQQINIVMQGAHLNSAQPASFSGTNASSALSLSPSQLPSNGVSKATLTFTPQQKGANKNFTVSFAGADPENTGSLLLTTNVKAAGTTPSVALASGITVKEMSAEPLATDSQLLDFTGTDIIGSVNLSIEQPAGGPFRINTSQFYYSATSDKLLNHTVTVTFAPKQAGAYDAVLHLVTPLAETLDIPLHGVSAAPDASAIVERFTADQTMDSRFTGSAWTGYHKFDRGYWKLDGTWNSKNNVTLEQGSLYYDELIADGISKVTVYPVATSQVATLEYSVDGGGHWSTVLKASADGSYAINTHRPTIVRIVNPSDASLEVDSVKIQPANSGSRQAFGSIEEAMLRNVDKEPQSLLNETFTGLRHTRMLGLQGWQNLALLGARPFYAWQQKDAGQEVVENEVAQISFYKYATEDNTEQESWLISPTLSYKKAAGKKVTFRLRFANAIENGGELFGFYIITENNGQPTAHYVDLNSLVPYAVTVDAEKWYDYTYDLSTADSLGIDDLFHVAFSFYSPVGGSATSLNFMIDDVTFGRTDLPEIAVDKEILVYDAVQGKDAEPQGVNITTTNATDKVTIDVVPSTADNYFTLSATSLPSVGGALAVGFHTDDANDHAAMLLIQTRSASPVVVKLLAHVSTTDGINSISADGKQGIFIEGGQLLINGSFKTYSIYSVAGSLLKHGAAQNVVSLQGIPQGVVIVKLDSDNGSKVYRLVNK